MEQITLIRVFFNLKVSHPITIKQMHVLLQLTYLVVCIMDRLLTLNGLHIHTHNQQLYQRSIHRNLGHLHQAQQVDQLSDCPLPVTHVVVPRKSAVQDVHDIRLLFIVEFEALIFCYLVHQVSHKFQDTLQIQFRVKGKYGLKTLSCNMLNTS